MENIHIHRNIKLVNNEVDYFKTVMKPNFKSGTLYGPDLIGCEMGTTILKINKAVYIGQAMLDLRKTIMYKSFITIIWYQSMGIRFHYAI